MEVGHPIESVAVGDPGGLEIGLDEKLVCRVTCSNTGLPAAYVAGEGLQVLPSPFRVGGGLDLPTDGERSGLGVTPPSVGISLVKPNYLGLFKYVHDARACGMRGLGGGWLSG